MLLLKKVHQGISNRRRDFLHQHSTAVIRKYGTVKVEGLKVSAMSRGNLAKQILDCSWSEWFRQLRYKAAEAGRRLVAVDPKYTSQICSQCGFKHRDNRKTQADFACLSCGYQDNADHNAAVNISARKEPLDANVSGVTLCVVQESPPFRAGRFNRNCPHLRREWLTSLPEMNMNVAQRYSDTKYGSG